MTTPDSALDDCSGAEPFVLQVLGDSMAPEFVDGDIIVVEPEGLARDGSYVVAWAGSEWTFRQLRGREGDWRLHALDPSIADLAIEGLDAVRGVVIQKSVPGRRRASRRYV